MGSFKRIQAVLNGLHMEIVPIKIQNNNNSTHLCASHVLLLRLSHEVNLFFWKTTLQILVKHSELKVYTESIFRILNPCPTMDKKNILFAAQ